MARALLTVLTWPLTAALLAACSPSDQPTAQRPPATLSSTGAPPASAPPVASAPVTAMTAIAALPDFTALVERVGPAVVNVTTTGTRAGAGVSQQQMPNDPLFDFFRRFMPPDNGGGSREYRTHGIGSGFVIDAQGYVLTNAHVVAGSDDVTLRLPRDKREYKAKVVGADPQTDVALLKVEATGLPTAPVGDSSKLRAGEWVVAIGSPFGFANTITAGIVSATERSLPDETYVPFIQTDVAVNPGNSGGPLLNTRGEVIGINSQIYSRTGGYQGVSFAIPIAVAMDIAQQLRTQGHVTRGRLGIGIQEVSTQLAQSFKLADARGALVTAVEADGPAAKAGVSVGDVILRFDNKDVAAAADLPRLVASTKPGTEVPIELWHDGAARTVKATIVAAPAPQQVAQRATQGREPGKASGRLGLMVSELPPQGRRALGVDYGLVVENVAGPNADAPLEPGDVIIAINNKRFKNLDEFNRHVAQAPAGGTVALLVRRGEATLFVPVTVAQG
jgi:serine protease Do